MAITNGNYKQILIEQKRKLQFDDKVIFNIPKCNIFYTVRDDFLDCTGRENSAIFNELGLDKSSFSSKHYGYDLKCGDWPCSHTNDYEALTRLVIALYEEIERQDPSKKPVSEPSKEISEKSSSKETNFVLPKLKTKSIKIIL